MSVPIRTISTVLAAALAVSALFALTNAEAVSAASCAIVTEVKVPYLNGASKVETVAKISCTPAINATGWVRVKRLITLWPDAIVAQHTQQGTQNVWDLKTSGCDKPNQSHKYKAERFHSAFANPLKVTDSVSRTCK